MSGHNPRCDPPASKPPMASLPAGRATAAPELREAMAETAKVRDGYARLCQEFGPAWQSGQGARISLTVLNRHRVAALLPALSPREASGKPDMWDRQQAEIDQLTAERDEARAAMADLASRYTAHPDAGLSSWLPAHILARLCQRAGIDVPAPVADLVGVIDAAAEADRTALGGQ